MPNEDSQEAKRRDPRYVETSENLSDWIQVRIAKQFGDQREDSGVLVDLTPRAVKVAIPGDLERARNYFSIGTRLLITFRFRNLAATTATATVARADVVQHGLGLVLFFDFIRESDREAILKICSAFTRPPKDKEGDDLGEPPGEESK